MFTLLFGGLFYYTIPLLIGEITLLNVVYNEEINNMVYVIYCFSFLVSFFFMYKNDSNQKKVIQYKLRGNLNKQNSKALNFIVCVIGIIFIIGVYRFGFSNYLITTKGDNEENMTLIQTGVMLSMIMLPVTVYYRKRYTFVVCFLILLSFLLYGARSYFVVAIISSAFIFFKFREIQLIKKFYWFVLGTGFAFGMAIFKNVFSIIKSASFNDVINVIKNLNYDLVISQVIIDPMAVIYNLNYTINNKLDLSIDYLFHRGLSIIPGGGSLFSLLMGKEYPRYASVLADYYTDVHWGLASSLYAELIAISGYFGFVLIYILMNKIVASFNNNVKLKDLNVFNLVFISSFTYLLFYSHRLDITFVLGIFKYSILIWLFLKFVAFNVNKKVSIK